MKETQKITEINYKDKYIEKLEEQNKMLLEVLQKKDKMYAIVECILTGLLCIVMLGFSISYFWSPYDYQDDSTTISGDNNQSILNNSMKSSDVGLN